MLIRWVESSIDALETRGCMGKLASVCAAPVVAFDLLTVDAWCLTCSLNVLGIFYGTSILRCVPMDISMQLSGLQVDATRDMPGGIVAVHGAASQPPAGMADG